MVSVRSGEVLEPHIRRDDSASTGAMVMTGRRRYVLYAKRRREPASDTGVYSFSLADPHKQRYPGA